jgi:hypothetical protein
MTTGESAPRSHFTARSLAAIVVLFVPGVVVGLTPWAAGAEFLFVGLVATLVALLHGPRFALGIALYTAVLVGVVQLAIPYPVAAVALMVIVGLGIGASALRGIHSPVVVASSWPAVLLLQAPVHLPLGAWAQNAPGAAAVAVVFTLVGGLFTVAVGTALVPDVPRSTRKSVDRRTALVYGLTLAIVLGAATAALTLWGERSLGGWVLLTILVIARPTLTETRRRLVGRSLGTLVGGALAAALVLLIPLGTVLTVLGLVALAVAILVQLKKASYAIYAVALTAAVVLLDSHGGSRLGLDLARVGFTLAGAVVAAGVVIVLQLLQSRRSAPPAKL